MGERFEYWTHKIRKLPVAGVFSVQHSNGYITWLGWHSNSGPVFNWHYNVVGKNVLKAGFIDPFYYWTQCVWYRMPFINCTIWQTAKLLYQDKIQYSDPCCTLLNLTFVISCRFNTVFTSLVNLIEWEPDGGGVVHKDVDSSKSFNSCFDASLNLILIPDVHNAGQSLTACCLNYRGR